MKNPEKELILEIAKCTDDPYRFVQLIFPWGSGTLKDESGPDVWQTETLRDIGRHCKNNPEEALRMATASGHGIGKSTLVAWIILWFISTREHPQIIVTANTLTQLNSKTWRELAKWHKLSLNKHWFAWTATKFYVRQHPETWFATAIPWSKDNPEAFAGTHEKHVLVVYDEASGVDDIIWEVTEGAMTTPGAMWFAFGNPTKNTGRFRECFGKFKHRWLTRQVDSREAKKADKKQLQQWVDDYGEDSDFVRVRVRGVFPRSGSEQFISNDIMEFCNKYQAADFEHMPKILGVDVARFGDNQTVISMRQGRKVFPFLKYRGLDTQQVASRVSEVIEDQNPQVVFVDGGGVGGGVIDRLKTLGYGLKIVDVQSGFKADDSTKYYNKRAEMWGRLRDALKAGLELPEDREFQSEVTSVEYAFSDKNQIQIEKKTEMKSRGLESPDSVDALCLTFAQNVSKISKKMEKKEIAYMGAESWMM